MPNLKKELTAEKQQLFKLLQQAVELEHSTIPPYLVAYFTIEENTNAFAYDAIRSVVMEEMLHMSLACQILNAVGGEPLIDHPGFIPEYPLKLNFKDRPFDVGLIKFSKEAIATFMEIEKPADVPLHVKGEDLTQLVEKINLGESTIGEFYAVIKQKLIDLTGRFGESEVFSGDPARQLTPEDYYGGGGRLIQVTNLASAIFAINIIVEQGEGTEHSIWDGDADYFGQEREVAHFFRFKEIYTGRLYQKGDRPKGEPTGPKVKVDWKAVKNMIDDPQSTNFPKNSSARQKADDFNQLYSQFLQVLHRSFNGQPQLLRKAVAMMYQLKYLAQELLNIELPRQAGKVAGPPFRYVHPKKRVARE